MKLRNRSDLVTFIAQPGIIPGNFSKKNVKPRLHAQIYNKMPLLCSTDISYWYAGLLQLAGKVHT
jgi:hypothetical protein